jgi:transposase
MSPSAHDVRRALLAAYETHAYSQRAVAERCGVSPATVRTSVRRQRATGTPDPWPPRGGRTTRRTQPGPDRGRQLLIRRHDLTLTDLCAPIAQAYHTRVRGSTLGRLLPHRGVPRKTRRATPQNALPHAANERAGPRAHRARRSTSSGASWSMTPASTGRCPVWTGGRLRGPARGAACRAMLEPTCPGGAPGASVGSQP